jgi:hypothetical protein
MPLNGVDNGTAGVRFRHLTPTQGQPLPRARFEASPDYFRAVGVPLVAGRLFEATDEIGRAPPLAAHYQGRENPVGQLLPFTAVDVATGAVVWRIRTLGRTTGLRSNGLLLLDEDGQLSIANATREGLTIRSRAAVVVGVGWPAATVATGRIYIRNRKVIKAFEL